MTHIIEVEGTELTDIESGKAWILVRPKREIKAEDNIVFECGMRQHTSLVKDVQTDPGLMKGWVLLTLEN